MLNQKFHYWSILLIFATGINNLSGNCALAQITQDNTLPNNSNIIQDANTFNINGGTEVGRNLFHSFRDFSVPNGFTASFKNGDNIQNIISRVTGSSVSNIDGLIKANGVNIFLINPNGITFGSNARLDIGGSFLASTARSLKFPNNLEFSATNPQSAPLLSINVPIGLQFGVNPGSIVVQGDGQGIRTKLDLIDTPNALRVQPNQTLALVGGDVTLEGATLKTAGGRIELGSVAGEGLVTLTPTNKGFSLSYDSGIQNFRDIQLSQQAVVDASGEGGGDIQIQGRRIALTKGSQIEASTLRTSAGGTLLVNGTESVKVSGISLNGDPTGLYSLVYQEASGAGGNLVIKTGQLIVEDGAQIGTTTFGAGKGGNLTVTADSIQLIDTFDNRVYFNGLFASSRGDGDAGNITINTRNLLVEDGALISTNTLGAGKGGNLSVTADSVQLINTSGNPGYRNGLFASSGGDGDTGNIMINTRNLVVQNGAQINVETFGAGKGGNLSITADSIRVIGSTVKANPEEQFPSTLSTSSGPNATGDAGDIKINTRNLLVQGGAQIKTTTFGAGKGGDLAVNAESVQLTGAFFFSRNSGLFANSEGTGDAGSLSINTQQLLITEGGFASVQSTGEGIAGTLNITARFVRLDKGIITAQTSYGKGGDLNLKITDLLLMQDESRIYTLSNLEQQPGNGDGGNIFINIPSGFIVAVNNENNDINANAFNGSGGKITINAAGIFGIAPLSREELAKLRPNDLDPGKLSTNDITAISQTNPTLNGIIELNILNPNPNAGLVQLPTIAVNTEIAQTCDTPRYAQSSFIITGRGGLPANPTKDVLTPDAVEVGWVSLKPNSDASGGLRLRNNSPAAKLTTTPERIVEASGWAVNQKGEVVLISQVNKTAGSSWQKDVPCSASQVYK